MIRIRSLQCEIVVHHSHADELGLDTTLASQQMWLAQLTRLLHLCCCCCCCCCCRSVRHQSQSLHLLADDAHLLTQCTRMSHQSHPKMTMETGPSKPLHRSSSTHCCSIQTCSSLPPQSLVDSPRCSQHSILPPPIHQLESMLRVMQCSPSHCCH